MKERLEEIKELVKKIESILYDEWRQQELTNLIELLYYADHVDWLINRVEELETQLYINTNNMKQLQKENERYKQRIEELEKENEKVKEGNFGLSKIINSKRKEIKRYKQALELIYKDTFYESENDLVSPIHVIRKRAEKALKGE